SSKTLGGPLTFAVATFESTLAYREPEILIKTDGNEARRCRIMNVSVANGRYFGGGMKIAPEARLDDGLFDVICIKALGMLEMISNVHKLYKGTHLGMPQVASTRAVTVEAEPVDPKAVVRIEVDGEGPGRLPATFSILPSALAVRCPGI